MEEKKVFDYERIEAGIAAVCKAMDDLDMTLLERWHVTNSVSKAALGMMQDSMREALKEHEPIEMEPVEAQK